MVKRDSIDSTEVTLDAGQSLSDVEDYLFVDVLESDEVVIHIDGGSTGTRAAQYTMTHHTLRNQADSPDDAWFFDHEVTEEDALSWRVPVAGEKWRIDVTNTSGNNGETYRIVVTSR